MQLWTESGLAMHAKLVLTGYAWDLQRTLVDSFFGVKPEPQAALGNDDLLRLVSERLEEQLNPKDVLKVATNKYRVVPANDAAEYDQADDYASIAKIKAAYGGVLPTGCNTHSLGRASAYNRNLELRGILNVSGLFTKSYHESVWAEFGVTIPKYHKIGLVVL